MNTVKERETLDLNQDKPKMIHIGFPGEDELTALCGYRCSKVLPLDADGSEDCIVCVDIARSKGWL